MNKTNPCEQNKARFFVSNVATRKWSGFRASLRRVIISIVAIFLICPAAWSEGFITEASYYTLISCLREGTSGTCASGERLNDEALTCASWDYKFGTVLRITNQRNNRSALVRVNDRGPSKRLYRRGRKIDLSRKAFESIESLKAGLAQVKVEVVRRAI